MRHPFSTSLVTLTVVVSSFTARAQSAPPSEGLGKPCREDARKFCTNVPPGRGRVAVCLMDHSADLSEACRTQLNGAPPSAK